MTIQIPQGRAYELCSFLRVTPKEIGNVKDFAKIQRFRLAVEKAIEPYKNYMDDFVKWRLEEAKPYQQQIQEIERPEAFTDEEFTKYKSEKALELDKVFAEAIRERADEAAKYEDENKSVVVEVTCNEEDLSRARQHFEAKGHEFAFWAMYPDVYLTVAKALQVPDIE